MAQERVTEKLKKLGPLTFHEILVIAHYFLLLVLLFTRRSKFLTGSAELIAHAKIGEASCAFTVLVLMFMFPSKPDFLYMFSKDEEKRPKERSEALITLELIFSKLQWSLVFIFGGGLAIVEGTQKSGLSSRLLGYLYHMKDWPNPSILCMVCLMTLMMSPIFNSAALAYLVLPMAVEFSRTMKMHPLYLMLPLSVTCSGAFCLPVSTPPNALISGACHLESIELLKVGIVIQALYYVIVITFYLLWAPVIWDDLNTYPKWADKS